MVEVKFENRELTYLETALQEVSSSEQTQEIKLTDGMPDIGQVVSAWGQPILRGKEWRNDSIAYTGGMMVWVLYQSEDGGSLRCIDAWVPFQMKWDLPALVPEGKIRLSCLPRFVDARPVSPRKLMVRCGMGVMVSALTEQTRCYSQPDQQETGVQLRKETYPVRLFQEAGEKSFLLDDALSLPESLARPEKIIYYCLEPKVTDRKVLGGKLVFRGNGMMHVLYADQEGQLVSWDFEVPFSQYAELDREHGTDAQAEIWPAVTSLEVELEESGNFRVKCGVAAQYLITDKILLELVQDAYCPGREIELTSKILELPVVLENRRETVTGEASLVSGGAAVADAAFYGDFPRLLRTDKGVDMELPGTFQALYYDEQGHLNAGSSRWEGHLNLPADENSCFTVLPGAVQVQAAQGNPGIQMKGEIPLEITATVDQGFHMVTGVELGENCQLDPMRPSLILRRAGSKCLWDMAKASGSTVEAIRKANDLQGDPVPGQILLIPVP